MTRMTQRAIRQSKQPAVTARAMNKVKSKPRLLPHPTTLRPRSRTRTHNLTTSRKRRPHRQSPGRQVLRQPPRPPTALKRTTVMPPQPNLRATRSRYRHHTRNRESDHSTAKQELYVLCHVAELCSALFSRLRLPPQRSNSLTTYLSVSLSCVRGLSVAPPLLSLSLYCLCHSQPGTLLTTH